MVYMIWQEMSGNGLIAGIRPIPAQLTPALSMGKNFEFYAAVHGIIMTVWVLSARGAHPATGRFPSPLII